MEAIPNGAGSAGLFIEQQFEKFFQGSEWDLQRLHGPHPEYLDYSTVAIGLYAAALGMPASVTLEAENQYAKIKSNFKFWKDLKQDENYVYLPEFNIQNTMLGYELFETLGSEP